MRFILVAASAIFLSGSVLADHLPEADAKYYPWWNGVPDHKRQSVKKFCVSFLDLSSSEQLEVIYYDEEKTFEAWRMCDWLSIHNKL